MNVSLTEKLEKFVRDSVKFGDYETASDVVHEGLRLLQQRDKKWKAEVRAKITQGMDSFRAERTFTPEQAKARRNSRKKQRTRS